MTSLSPPVFSSLAVQLPGRRVWTRDAFLQAHQLGFFAPDTRVELLKGEVFDLMTMLGPHATALFKTLKYLESAFDTIYMVRPQMPLMLNADDLPEPDLAVVEGNADDYNEEHPSAAVMVVEISDSTLAKDRTLKAAIYAEAAIAEYWIVNLVDRVLEVHRQPAALAGEPLNYGYRSIMRYAESDSLAPLAAPNALITVGQLLPNP